MRKLLKRLGGGLPRAFAKRLLSSGPIPTYADAVVIGGGSLGCNTLYHLTKVGLQNSVLLERDRLTSGTTWHTAGLLWRVRPSDVDIELVARTRNLNKEILLKETGVNTNWIENGGLLLATCQNRLNEIKRLYTLAKFMGIECYMIQAHEVKELFPVMDVGNVIGALYTPGDGLMDPSALMNALTKAAEKEGAKVFEQTSVLGISTEDSPYGNRRRITGVHTQYGTIKTNAVICCAGAWSPSVGEMVGVDIPLVPFKHCYVITEPIKGLGNVPNCRDPDGSYYLRLQGKALEVGGFESAPTWLSKAPDNFSFSLFDFPWDSFSELMEAAVKRVPSLAETGIKSEICGPESFTPDHQPLFGEAPNLRGFYMGCGLNSQGMMYGGGFGEELANWVAKGRPQKHMYKFDIRRLNPTLLKNRKWVEDKSQEGLANNYSLGFLLDQPFAGRNMIKDPLHETLLHQGCVYEEKMGWERPGWFATDGKVTPVLDYDYYGSYGVPKHESYPYWDRLRTGYSFGWPTNDHIIANEALNCRHKVNVFNMSSFGKFYLYGPDAPKLAEWMFTADIRRPPGSVVYSCMLNPEGRIENDLTVSVLGDHDFIDHPAFPKAYYYVAAGGSVREQAKTHILNVIQDSGMNAQLYDATQEMCLLSVQGPFSRATLQMLTESDLNGQHLPFSTHCMARIAGYPCRVLRVSYVGEMGYEIHVPWDAALPVYEAIMDAGQQFGIMNSGYRAIASLSAEKGYVLWGSDIRHTDTPLEAGLGFACKVKQDIPFLGREKVMEQKQNGIKQRLVCLALDEYLPMWGWETIRRNGEYVGMIRRAEPTFYLEKSIGYGMIKAPDNSVITPDWIRSGEYTVEIMGKEHDAKVFLKPPFDLSNKRLKGIYENLQPPQILRPVTPAEHAFAN